MTRKQRERLVDIAVILLIVVAACMMAGCDATRGAITIRVPVPVECKEPEPERPVMPTDGLRKGANIEQFARAARAELAVRDGYEDRLVTALRACRSPIKPVDYRLKP